MKNYIYLLFVVLTVIACDSTPVSNKKGSVYVVNKNALSLREYWTNRFTGSVVDSSKFIVYLRIGGKDHDISNLKKGNDSLKLSSKPSKIDNTASLLIKYDDNGDGVFEETIYQIADFGTHTLPVYSKVKFSDSKKYSIVLGPTYNLWTIKEKLVK